MADPELDEVYQQFAAGAGVPEMRLRDAFAQLLAQGNRQALPVEALWTRQGSGQFPPPASPVEKAPAMTDPNAVLPQRQFGVPEPDASFPTAPMGPGDIRYEPAPKPFGGKGRIVKPAPRGSDYSLPKSRKRGS